MDRKSILLRALGYPGLFIAVFIISLYLTFDANIIKPHILNQINKRGPVRISVHDLSLKGLVGLECRGVMINPRVKVAGSNAPPMTIDKLSISPSISSLPGIVSAMKSSKQPPLDFSFKARIGSGEIEGDVNQDEKSSKVELNVKSLPMSRIVIPTGKLKGLALLGTMNGKTRLDFKDNKKPETWNGSAEIEIDKFGFKDFKFSVLSIAGINMDKATLILDMESGNVKIKPFKLQGKDVPLNLTGTLQLKNPLKKSVIQIKGPLKFSEEYKQKNPMVSALAASDEYSLNKPLDNLIPGF